MVPGRGGYPAPSALKLLESIRTVGGLKLEIAEAHSSLLCHNHDSLLFSTGADCGSVLQGFNAPTQQRAFHSSEAQHWHNFQRVLKQNVPKARVLNKTAYKEWTQSGMSLTVAQTLLEAAATAQAKDKVASDMGVPKALKGAVFGAQSFMELGVAMEKLGVFLTPQLLVLACYRYVEIAIKGSEGTGEGMGREANAVGPIVVSSILDFLHPHIPTLLNHEIVTMLQCMARSGSVHRQALNAAAEALLANQSSRIQACGPYEVSALIAAAATLQLDKANKEAWDCLCQRADAVVINMEMQQMAQVLRGLATAEEPTPHVWTKAIKLLSRDLPQKASTTPHHLISCLRSIAVAGIPAEQLFDEMSLFLVGRSGKGLTSSGLGPTGGALPPSLLASLASAYADHAQGLQTRERKGKAGGLLSRGDDNKEGGVKGGEGGGEEEGAKEGRDGEKGEERAHKATQDPLQTLSAPATQAKAISLICLDARTSLISFSLQDVHTLLSALQRLGHHDPEFARLCADLISIRAFRDGKKIWLSAVCLKVVAEMYPEHHESLLRSLSSPLSSALQTMPSSFLCSTLLAIASLGSSSPSSISHLMDSGVQRLQTALQSQQRPSVSLHSLSPFSSSSGASSGRSSTSQIGPEQGSLSVVASEVATREASATSSEGPNYGFAAAATAGAVAGLCGNPRKQRALRVQQQSRLSPLSLGPRSSNSGPLEVPQLGSLAPPAAAEALLALVRYHRHGGQMSSEGLKVVHHLADGLVAKKFKPGKGEGAKTLVEELEGEARRMGSLLFGHPVGRMLEGERD